MMFYNILYSRSTHVHHVHHPLCRLSISSASSFPVVQNDLSHILEFPPRSHSAAVTNASFDRLRFKLPPLPPVALRAGPQFGVGFSW